jgi:hypothetical protein
VRLQVTRQLLLLPLTGGSFLEFTDGNTTAGRSPLVGAITDGLSFYTSAGSYSQKLGIDSLGGITGTSQAGGHVVFNEGGIDADFRVESDTNANALFVQGSDGFVGIGTSSPEKAVHVKTAVNNTAVVRIESTAVDSYPTLSLKNDAREYQLTAHGPLGDKFTIYDGTAGSHRLTIDSSGNVGIGTSSPSTELHVVASSGYAELRLQGASGSSGTLEFYDSTTKRGDIYVDTSSNIIFRNTAERMRIDSTGGLITNPAAGGHAVFNEGGVDADFRVESDTNTHMLFVDAGANAVGIGNATPANYTGAGANTFVVGTNAANHGITVVGPVDGYSSFAFADSAGAGTGADYSGLLQYYHNTDTLFIYAGSGQRMSLDAGSTVFNDIGTDTDFRVESNDNANMLFVDGGANHVNIGTSTDYGGTLNVNDSIYVAETDTPRIRLQNIGNSDTELGINGLGAGLDTFYIAQYAGIAAGEYDFRIVGGTREFTFARGGVVNEGGADSDFRVESDANANALIVDASGSGSIGFGGTDVFSYGQTSGNGVMGYIIDNGSVYGSLTLSNNADRGWSMMYCNKFAYTSGDDKRFIQWGVNGGAICSIELNDAGTAVVYQTTSDRRLKENIQDLTGGIETVKKLRPRSFEWVTSEDNTFPSQGFIADEADGIIPEIVSGEANAVYEDGNPSYQSMEYSKLVPILTAALKESITKIEDLEARITALENA